MRATPFFFVALLASAIAGVAACQGAVAPGSGDGGSSGGSGSSGGGGSSGVASSGGTSGAGTSACAVDPAVPPPREVDHDFRGFSAVATHGAYVYYAGTNAHQVLRAPLAGGKYELFSGDTVLLMKSHDERMCWLHYGVDVTCFFQDVRQSMPVNPYGAQSGQYQDSDIDFDGTYVYWSLAAGPQGYLVRSPLSGAGPTETVVGGLLVFGSGRSIALAGDRIVFTDSTDYQHGSELRISTCAKSGCAAPDVIATVGNRDAGDRLGRIATDDTYVYVAIHHPGPNGERGGSVRRIRLTGGEDTPLVTCAGDSPVNVLVDGDDVYVLTQAGPYPQVDPNGVPAGNVMVFSRASGARRVLATNQRLPASLTVTPTTLFWTTEYSELFALPR